MWSFLSFLTYLEIREKIMAETKRNKGGKPITWTPERVKEVFDEIIDRMCEGELISEILRGETRPEGYPRYSTFMDWIRESEELADKYAGAREIQAEIELDEIRKLADEPNIITLMDTTTLRDELGNPTGTTVKKTQVDNVARSRLEIDARKFRLGRMASKYNDKLSVDLNKKTSVVIELDLGLDDDDDDDEEGVGDAG